jgi:hypothetical protein
VASRYAQYINKKCRRTGKLRKGRQGVSLVQSERCLPICMRYRVQPSVGADGEAFGELPRIELRISA